MGTGDLFDLSGDLSGALACDRGGPGGGRAAAGCGRGRGRTAAGADVRRPDGGRQRPGGAGDLPRLRRADRPAGGAAAGGTGRFGWPDHAQFRQRRRSRGDQRDPRRHAERLVRDRSPGAGHGDGANQRAAGGSPGDSGAGEYPGAERDRDRPGGRGLPGDHDRGRRRAAVAAGPAGPAQARLRDQRDGRALRFGGVAARVAAAVHRPGPGAAGRQRAQPADFRRSRHRGVRPGRHGVGVRRRLDGRDVVRAGAGRDRRGAGDGDRSGGGVRPGRRQPDRRGDPVRADRAAERGAGDLAAGGLSGSGGGVDRPARPGQRRGGPAAVRLSRGQFRRGLPGRRAGRDLRPRRHRVGRAGGVGGAGSRAGGDFRAGRAAGRRRRRGGGRPSAGDRVRGRAPGGRRGDGDQPDLGGRRYPDHRRRAQQRAFSAGDGGGVPDDRGDLEEDRHPAVAGADRGDDRRGHPEQRSALRPAMVLPPGRRLQHATACNGSSARAISGPATRTRSACRRCSAPSQPSRVSPIRSRASRRCSTRPTSRYC